MTTLPSESTSAETRPVKSEPTCDSPVAISWSRAILMTVPSGSSPGRVGTEVTMSASGSLSFAGCGFAVSTTGARQGSGSPIIRSSELQFGRGTATGVGTELPAAGAGACAGAAGAAAGLVVNFAAGVAGRVASLVIVSSGGGCDTPVYGLGFCAV